MTQKIDEPVSVSLTFDSKSKKATPKALIWNNRLYAITKIGFHHTYKVGETLIHAFSVSTPTLFFRIELDTNNLHWKIVEIADAA